MNLFVDDIYCLRISMLKILITALLEISDHDGYCSGNECEYTLRKIVHLCDVPEEYQDYEVGKLEKEEEKEEWSDKEWSEYWIHYLPEQEVNTHESYYCELNPGCESVGLERHDYRYTILNVEIVDVV